MKLRRSQAVRGPGDRLEDKLSGAWPFASAACFQSLSRSRRTVSSSSEVPWYRREPGALVLVLALLFTPLLVALCIIARTRQVYRKKYDKHGSLRVWGPEDKAAAVLILIIQCFFIWAVKTMG